MTNTKFTSLKILLVLVYIGTQVINNKQKWVPLRAMKTFIRKKMGHAT